jgi:hypothetical protein
MRKISQLKYTKSYLSPFHHKYTANDINTSYDIHNWINGGGYKQRYHYQTFQQ